MMTEGQAAQQNVQEMLYDVSWAYSMFFFSHSVIIFLTTF